VFDYAHELDVQKRPRTYAIVMMSLPNTSKGWQFSDFLSLNRYYGWYVMGGYQMCDAEVGFRKELDGWQAIAGDRPLIFTEYGADTLPSEHKLPSVMWSQEYQDEYLEMNHRVFDSYDFIQGELVWNFADFQTTEGIMRANGNKKGVFTRQRQPKDAAFVFKARWESLPLDYKG
ncbi:MAG: beta-glucuronidase, partial [Clostridiales bacterium]|nr:beta-glucuronidase [Clostridiales bacterium]